MTEQIGQKKRRRQAFHTRGYLSLKTLLGIKISLSNKTVIGPVGLSFIKLWPIVGRPGGKMGILGDIYPVLEQDAVLSLSFFFLWFDVSDFSSHVSRVRIENPRENMTPAVFTLSFSGSRIFYLEKGTIVEVKGNDRSIRFKSLAGYITVLLLKESRYSSFGNGNNLVSLADCWFGVRCTGFSRHF